MTNICPNREKLCFDTNSKTVYAISNVKDSTFEDESFEQYLKKNDFDSEWMMMMKDTKGCNFLSIEDNLQDKKSSEWSSSFSSLWGDNARPKITQSFSNLEGKAEFEQICKEQFELFNVSTPDLISGHICQDVCICFCNRKMKQANKLRHIIFMCASNKSENMDSSFSELSASSSLTSHNASALSSSSTSPSKFSGKNSFLESSASGRFGNFHELPLKKYCKSWKFSDDCAIIEIHYRKGDRQLYGSCPLQSYRIVSLYETFNICDTKVVNRLGVEHLNLGWEETISLRRIQNEIAVIQLKHAIINKDYNRRKWAKLEERKIVEKFGRIDDKTRMKKLEEIDYELLKIGDKFRKESETIKRMFNAEIEKLIKLRSKYESPLSVLFYQTCVDTPSTTDDMPSTTDDGRFNAMTTSNDTHQSCTFIKNNDSKECEKRYSKHDMLSKMKCLESKVMKEDINDNAMGKESKDEAENDHISRDGSRNTNAERLSDSSSFIEVEVFTPPTMMNNSEVGPRVQLRKSNQCKNLPQNRPLTRYLPVRGDVKDFNLKSFIEQAGHCLDLCLDVKITSSSVRGFLKKVGRRLRTWRRRWFVFDRSERQLCYYSDGSESVLKGKIPFSVIEDVYIDTSMPHCANNKAVFCLKTKQKTHILAAQSNRARQVWMDALFTGAEAYQEYLL